MNDISKTIEAKSDQLNADDLISGGRTVKITSVALVNGDQPLAIHYEGDNGKPFKPCKSMRRVLIKCWGSDGNSFIGQTMTLFRDDSVTFGGQAVGGIRISHVTGIDKDITMSLTASRKSKKPYTVRVLKEEPAVNVNAVIKAGTEAANKGVAAFTVWGKKLTTKERSIISSNAINELNAIAKLVDKDENDDII